MSRIVFVSNRLSGGGSERVLVTLANEMSKRGHDVTILSFVAGDSYPINHEIEVIVLGCSKKSERIKKIRSLIKQINPQNVIAFEYFVNMQVIMACCGLNTNVIVSERNDPAREGGSFPKSAIRNFLYRFCDILVCQTEDAKNYFPKYVQKHSVIILNPLMSNLPERWAGERNKEVVCFCRLEKQKNLPLLVDSFKSFHENYSDYSLHIYGNGKERDNLTKYVDECGLSSAAFVHEGSKDIHNIVLKSAMFVLPSDYEGLSNSMLEALAIGLPTICTDCPVGGARMVIENEKNGLLVPVNDRAAMIDAMLKIANDSNVANQLGQNASAIKNKLSIESICELWEKQFV